MTEEQLLADSDFIGFCGRWGEDRHCPLPFADWCLENMGELAFEACVWAHEKEERCGSNGKSRVCPKNWADGRPTWDTVGSNPREWYDDVPIFNSFEDYDSFPAAIAYYLTHFDRELAAKYPPKMLKAV